MKNNDELPKRNFLDRTISFFSPQAGLKREQARLGLDMMGKLRRYDGASNSSRFQQWRRPESSANAAILPSLPKLRNSSRDLTRNNPWAKNAQRVIRNNVVGSGPRAQIAGVSGAAKKKLENVFWDWANTTMIDSEGIQPLAGLLAQATNCIVESGEVIIRRRYRRLNGGLPIPVQIQVLEPDYLDETKDGVLSNGGQIIGGIEFSKRGERVAYWLREAHPGDVVTAARGAFQSFRIPASDVIHAFDPDRAGQGRGVPWCHSGIRRLKDYDDYEDSHLVRQKIAACFSVFITDASSTPVGATGLAATGPTEAQKDFVQPGMIEHLPLGKSVQFASPPGVSNYGEYARSTLLGVAAAYGITYESLTGDYSGVNYSSGRLGWIEMGRNITHWQNNIMKAMILDRIAAWFFGGCTIMGYNSENAYMKWIMPKREMMDPTKEVPAAIKAIRGGLTSLFREQQRLGLDPEEVLDEIEEGNKALDAKGILLDSDPRKLTSGGRPLADARAGASAEAGADDEE